MDRKWNITFKYVLYCVNMLYEGQSHLKVLTANLQETKHPQRDTKQTSLRQEPVYFNFCSLPYYASTVELLNVTLPVQCNLLTEENNGESNIVHHPGVNTCGCIISRHMQIIMNQTMQLMGHYSEVLCT